MNHKAFFDPEMIAGDDHQLFEKNGFFIYKAQSIRSTISKPLLEDIYKHQSSAIHSYIPGHKKGNTLPSGFLKEQIPWIIDAYRDPATLSGLSAIVGCSVTPVPLEHPMSIAALIYKDCGDWIGWHYDYNYYRGRCFTVLFTLSNAADHQSQSSSSLEIKTRKLHQSFSPEVNSMVIFEGSRVFHRVTPIAAKENRVVLSMLYATDSRTHYLKNFIRQLKDLAFVGKSAFY